MMTRSLSKSLLHFILCCLLVITQLHAAEAAPTIQWQVNNPFRFFQYESDFEIQRWAYSELTDQDKQNNPASATERKLNDPRWWRKTGADGKTHLEMLKVLRQAEKRAVVELNPRLGWASLLREDSNDTCWDASSQLYRDCESKTINVGPKSTYFDPTAHRVTSWLPNGSATATCHWTASLPVFVGPGQSAASPKSDFTAPCNVRVSLLVPNEQTVALAVTGDPTGNASENVRVDNLIIAGLGDSMASGEGNPDVPVRLDPYTGVAPAYDENKLLKNERTFDLAIGVPRRQNANAPALWIDRRCHRSIYSWQARVAIGVALTEPQHRSVTFVSYACSGSQVLPGLLYPWEGHEFVAPNSLTPDARRRLNRPQIDAVIDELCRDNAAPPSDYSFGTLLDPHDDYVQSNHIPRDKVKLRSCANGRMRSIDLLLVDIGVNDVGFTSLIANMFVTNGSQHYPGQISYSADTVRKIAGVIDFNAGTQRLSQAKPRFEALHAVIKSRLALRDGDESRVLFASYPSIVSATANGDLCPTGRASMTVSEIFEAQPEEVIKQADDFTERHMLPALAQYAAPWTYVQGHRSRYVGHGYCATATGGPNESGTGTAEITNMPYLVLSGGDGNWQFYNPSSAFFPYESRARWIRSFNDDYMIINYSKTAPVSPENPAQFNNPIDLARAPTGGPMHPTAEGHTYIADAVIQAARAKLKIGATGD
jgi:hypothetical protein